MCVASPSDRAEMAYDMAPTVLARQYKDPPYIVMDRAAYNQGVNASYDPYIAIADIVPPLVARGPHAVAYEET